MGIFGQEVSPGVQETREKVTTGRTAVFLDRDGTINEEMEFVCSPDELHLITGAANAIYRLNASGLVTCVISNQSGIARGFLTEDDLVRIHQKLERELSFENARVDRIYHCPHHPTEGKPPYNISCPCRKPRDGMLQAAKRDFSLDLNRSFIVGDRIVDIQAGKSVGAQTILVLTGYGRTTLEECRNARVHPDHIMPSLVEAVEYIVGENGSHAR